MPKKKFEVQDAIKASRGTTEMLLRFLEYKAKEQVTSIEMHDEVMKHIKVINYHLFGSDDLDRPGDITIENIDIQSYVSSQRKSIANRIRSLEREKEKVTKSLQGRFADLEREVTQVAALLDSHIKKRPARPLKKSQG